MTLIERHHIRETLGIKLARWVTIVLFSSLKVILNATPKFPVLLLRRYIYYTEAVIYVTQRVFPS